jgi:hypothetical protein
MRQSPARLPMKTNFLQLMKKILLLAAVAAFVFSPLMVVPAVAGGVKSHARHSAKPHHHAHHHGSHHKVA